jgi:hypothetical protein
MSEAASIHSGGERERKRHCEQSGTESPLSKEAAQELIRQNDWQRDAMKKSAHARELQGKALLRAGSGETDWNNGEQHRTGPDNGNSHHAEQRNRSPWQQLLDVRQEIRDDRHHSNLEKANRKDAQYLVRDSKKTAYEGRSLLRRSQREFDHGCTAQGLSDQKDAIMLLNESLKETAQGRDNWSRAQVDLYDARRRYSAAQHELKESRRQTNSSELCHSGQWQRDNNALYQRSQSPENSQQRTGPQSPGIDQRQQERQAQLQQAQLQQEQQAQLQEQRQSPPQRYTGQPARENYGADTYDNQPNFFERALQTVHHLTDRVHISVGLGNGFLNLGNSGYGLQRPYYQNYYNNNQYPYQNQNQYYQQPYYPNYNNPYQYDNSNYNLQVNPGYYQYPHRHHRQAQINPASLYEYYG